MFSGINLEDIAAQNASRSSGGCRVLLDVPVFHDDQHGTAMVVLATLTSALRVVGEQLEDVRIVPLRRRRSGTAILVSSWPPTRDDVVVGDVRGIVHREPSEQGRHPCSRSRTRDERTSAWSTLVPALDGTNVSIGVSVAGVVSEADIASMAPGRSSSRSANPDPEVDPIVARRRAAVVATGAATSRTRSTTSLPSPGCSAGCSTRAERRGWPSGRCWPPQPPWPMSSGTDALAANYIVPSVFHPDLATTVATAVRESVESGGT